MPLTVERFQSILNAVKAYATVLDDFRARIELEYDKLNDEKITLRQFADGIATRATQLFIPIEILRTIERENARMDAATRRRRYHHLHGIRTNHPQEAERERAAARQFQQETDRMREEIEEEERLAKEAKIREAKRLLAEAEEIETKPQEVEHKPIPATQDITLPPAVPYQPASATDMKYEERPDPYKTTKTDIDLFGTKKENKS